MGLHIFRPTHFTALSDTFWTRALASRRCAPPRPRILGTLVPLAKKAVLGGINHLDPEMVSTNAVTGDGEVTMTGSTSLSIECTNYFILYTKWNIYICIFSVNFSEYDNDWI